MKSLSFLFLMIFSATAFAMTEVICDGRQSGKRVVIEVDGRFGGSYFRDAILAITDSAGVVTRTRHNLTYRAPWGGSRRMTYEGAELRLEVDTWPDQVPQWQRPYFGTAYVRALNSYVQVNCRYPNIH